MTKKEKAIERDAFFTKEAVAKRFVAQVNKLYPFKHFDNVIEPSAGAGAIYQFLPKKKRVGVDLEPQIDGIIKSDFFNYTFPTGKNIVVGNPPFGKNSQLAVDFFNKCADDGADVIAFIIPRSWSKLSVQKRLNNDFELYSNVILQDDAFELEGESYNVGCCAQIWAKKPPAKHKAEWTSWNKVVKNDTLNQVRNYQIKHELVGKSLRVVKRGPKVKAGEFVFLNKGTQMRFGVKPENHGEWNTTKCSQIFDADFTQFAHIYKVGCPGLNQAELQMVFELSK